MMMRSDAYGPYDRILNDPVDAVTNSRSYYSVHGRRDSKINN